MSICPSIDGAIREMRLYDEVEATTRTDEKSQSIGNE